MKRKIKTNNGTKRVFAHLNNLEDITQKSHPHFVIYAKWVNMNHTGKHRGVEIDQSWKGKNGFVEFYKWICDNFNIEEIISSKLRLARIDFNKGFNKKNCDFITHSILLKRCYEFGLR